MADKNARDVGAVTDPAFDLSIVLNVHREGRLLHPTARSIGIALDEFQRAGGTAELIVVQDRPDEATLGYVASVLPTVIRRTDVNPIIVDNGDLGLSRNSGVAIARGTFVAFCDADNMVSAEWFARAVDMLRVEAERTVVHPAYVVSFDARDTLWKITSSRDRGFDPRVLAQSNYWDATCVTTRALASAVPYVETRAGEGFGPEDWHWNMETLVEGASHLVADETALFYRVKRSGSLLLAHEASDALLPPSRYLADLDAMRRLEGPVVEPVGGERSGRITPRRIVAYGARKGFGLGIRAARLLAGNRSRFEKATYDLRASIGAMRATLQPAPPEWGPMPEWLLRQWRDAHELDRLVFPEGGLLDAIDYWNPKRTAFADVYWDLLDSLTQDSRPIDYLFVAPWLRAGGADKVTLNYVSALVELRPEARVVVLATEPGDSPWKAQLPGTVEFVDVPHAFHAIHGSDQERLLAQALVQVAPKRIHLINSHVGFRVANRYGRAIAVRSKLFASAFTLDVWPSGRRWHYLLDGIREYPDFFSGIFVDNEALRTDLISTYALPDESIQVHYQPVDDSVKAAREATGPRNFSRDAPLRVLWAGRFDRQKRLDVYADLASAAKERGLPADFFAYGSALLDLDDSDEKKARVAGVTLRPPFDRTLATVGVEGFDVFVLTSQWEGLPITLLEAMSIGLPVIVPRVGGTGDVVTTETGLVVEGFDDVQGYVDALERVIGDYAAALERADAAATLIERDHSWRSFRDRVAAAPNYLS